MKYHSKRVFETGQWVEIHSTLDPKLDGSDAKVMGRYGEDSYIIDLGFQYGGDQAIVLTQHCLTLLEESDA